MRSSLSWEIFKFWDWRNVYLLQRLFHRIQFWKFLDPCMNFEVKKSFFFFQLNPYWITLRCSIHPLPRMFFFVYFSAPFNALVATFIGSCVAKCNFFFCNGFAFKRNLYIHANFLLVLTKGLLKIDSFRWMLCRLFSWGNFHSPSRNNISKKFCV